MSSGIGLRGLVGKIFGRDGRGIDDPFLDNLASNLEATPDLLDDETRLRLERAIGYDIRDPRLFVQALTHRSYLQLVEDNRVESNERLEFLGDSILNMLIGEFLFGHYTDVQEGDLTKLRSRLVNKKALLVGAREVGLEPFIFLNSSAEQALRRGNRAIVADTFEAIVAAIYLDADRNLRPVKAFLQRTILNPTTFEEILEVDENYKSALLEEAQSRGYDAPRYVVVDEEGPDHERLFTVSVVVGEQNIGSGQGRSKKKAEQMAAKEGLGSSILEGSPPVSPEGDSEKTPDL